MTTTDSKSSTKKEHTAVDATLIRRLYQFIAPFKWWLGLALSITLVVAYLGPLRPYLIQVAIDEHISIGDLEGLKRIMLLILGVLVIESVLLVANTYLTNWVGQGTLKRLRDSVFDKIQRLHVQYFDRNPIGKLITRTTNDIEAVDELVSSGVVNMLGDVLRIIFITYFMFTMNWQLTLVSLSILPLLVYATIIFKRKVRVSFLKVRDQVARLNSFVQEHINGMNIVQLFTREQKELQRFNAINEEHRKAHIETIFYFALFWPIVEVIASLAMALVVWYGGGQAIQGAVTFGMLVAFIQYVRLFFLPIRDLSEKFNTLQSALAASERIFSVLDTKNEIIEVEHPIPFVRAKGKITFNNVWFKYAEQEDWVLKDVSFTAEPGQNIAIVGATGAGKSTIINVLTRFYDIQKGEILIDDIPITQLKIADLRKQFGLVLQDNALFSGSIRDNITLGDDTISQENVEHAAALVEADAFITKFPNKYNHVLAERGASLSMGQRQLICFVRAMVYNPSILILDEATASVDSETETLVNHAIEKVLSDRTAIVIAHRLSTIQHADCILVMHKGEIREKGTHRQLLKKEDGIYKKLYELQYKDQAIDVS